MNLIGAICYHIWRARNLLTFQNKNVPVLDVIHRAQECLFEYHRQVKPISEQVNRNTRARSNNDSDWIPPPKDTLKLNVDAHLMGDGHWGLGWILRKEDGSLVGAATKVVRGLNEAIEAEAMGVVEAIMFLTEFQNGSVIIETDNASIVKAIHRRSYPRLYWGMLARKIREAMEENPKISIQWVNRNKNTVAHVLANWAEVEPNKIWLDNLPPPPPPHIVGHIQKDMMPSHVSSV
ncbi:unnamed protein product [Trifolium pratense]|uniref:Uncharacterized protein n=1 Tax=Trifolium pratense TaxID=57577 RepID=A0ACB0J476_TRIPR|nr:unnamed protein product [Trifolium pratense]